MRPKDPPAGFTLVELLIVVAIIAVLAAMLVPSLAMSRQTTLRVMCAGNLRHINVALGMYLADGRIRYLPAREILPARDQFPDPNLTIDGIAGRDVGK